LDAAATADIVHYSEHFMYNKNKTEEVDGKTEEIKIFAIKYFCF